MYYWINYLGDYFILFIYNIMLLYIKINIYDGDEFKQ